MKNKLTLVVTTALMTGLLSCLAQAETTEKHVIALKTSDFELAETDISELQVGEAKTIVTDSGKTIDILRTEDGVEIYVDGQLLEMAAHDDGAAHKVHKRVVIECGDEGECEDEIVIAGHGEDFDLNSLHEGEHEVMIHKVVRECVSEVEGECEDHMVWTSDGEIGDIDIEALIEAHGGDAKVIRLHEDHDVDVHTEDGEKKLIVVRKHREDS